MPLTARRADVRALKGSVQARSAIRCLHVRTQITIASRGSGSWSGGGSSQPRRYFRETMPPSPSGRSVPTTHALWICACVTMDDAPIWLIYEDLVHGVMWCRVPDGATVSDIVDAESIAGGHTDPDAVLEWLKGEAPDPWSGGDGWDDGGVLDRFGRRLGQ